MTFDEPTALARYLALLRTRPDWFADADTPEGIRILTAPGDISAAREAARQDRAAQGHDVSDLRVGLLAADPYMTMVREAVRFPDGRLGLHNRVLDGACVAVMPLLDGQPVLIDIYRHGLRRRLLEFPRGALQSDSETPAEAAVRELAEEIGATALELTDLGPFTPGGAMLGTQATLFAARIDGLGRPDAGEAISRIRVVSVPELERAIAAGEILDGFTISLFARARLAGTI